MGNTVVKFLSTKAQSRAAKFVKDFDSDGLYLTEESALGTDPHNPDTDGDGVSDGEEVHVHFTDPLSPP